MSESIDNDCVNYNYEYIDLFIAPGNIVLNKLCSSTDKTYLFIISLFRIFIILSIIMILYYYTKARSYYIIIYSILLLYLLLNVIIICCIIYKKPLN